MSKNNTFVFNLEWYEVLKDYPKEIRFEVYEAIMWYASSGTLPKLGPLANMAFSFIRKEMDYNRDRYDSIVERRKEAGRRSAIAKQSQAGDAAPEQNQQVLANSTSVGVVEQNQQVLANSTSVPFVEHNQQVLAKPTSVSYNDNVNVNDNVNDNEIEKEKIEKEIFECQDSASGISAPLSSGVDSSDVPDAFESFRRAYPGRKAGAQVEFDNFKSKYPRQWPQIIPKLMPALQRLMHWRSQAQAAGQFVPQFKNLRTWINQQCWTEEFPDIPAPPKSSPDKSIPAVDPLKDEERRRRNAEADALDALRVQYERRIPPPDRRLINFNQYRYLHFDTVDDAQLAATLTEIRQGTRRLPTDVREMFGFTHDFKPISPP